MLNDLAQSVILGCGRKPFEVTGIDGDLGRVLQQLEALEEADRVLTAAAVLAPYETAGRLLEEGTRQVAACDPETQPVCSHEAATVLAEILAGSELLLDEWLTHAGSRRLLAPPILLPRLLEAGRKRVDRRDPIRQVAGNRGAWLAVQNADWGYALTAGLDAADQRVWDEGGEEARAAWLTGLRQRDPARALGLIEAGFAGESASARTKFVEALATGLSMDDEPFLERCLDDRSQYVRTTAAGLLARLPASRLAQRMAGRLGSVIEVERPPEATGLAARLARKLMGGSQSPKLTVALPEEFGPPELRDGLVEKSGKGGRFGEGAFRLLKLVTAAPLSFWSELDLGDPAAVLTAIRGSEWEDAVVIGLIDATLAQRSSLWARALLTGPLPSVPLDRPALIRLLPDSEQEAALIDELGRGTPEDRQKALTEIVREQPGPWGEGLSRAILNRFRAELPTARGRFAFHQVLTEMAPRLAPSVLPEAADGWPADHGCGPAFDDRLSEFSQIIRLRTRLSKGFSP